MTDGRSIVSTGDRPKNCPSVYVCTIISSFEPRVSLNPFEWILLNGTAQRPLKFHRQEYQEVTSSMARLKTLFCWLGCPLGNKVGTCPERLFLNFNSLILRVAG